ncbi:hypothetical protein [Janibacter melonis]|uniref:hypothetical protein n=1 Tax=Janibacter melonis TaxID=262209 RepID=UPI002096125A|nr:hypothetical protein [Janibacter melonis]
MRQAQPHRRGGGPDESTAVRRPAVGSRGDLTTELRLPGVPDRDGAEPGEVVVGGVRDEARLLVVADLVGAEVEVDLRLRDPVAVVGRVVEQQPGLVAPAGEVGALDRPAQLPVLDAGLGVLTHPGQRRGRGVVELLARDESPRPGHRSELTGVLRRRGHDDVVDVLLDRSATLP